MEVQSTLTALKGEAKEHGTRIQAIEGRQVGGLNLTATLH